MKYIITEEQFEKISNTFKGIPYRAIIEYIKMNLIALCKLFI